MAKLRAIIVADIEVLNLSAATEYEAKLKDLAKEIEKWGPPDAFSGGDRSEKISVEQVLAQITLHERRGRTGPLEQIVFRGTRGPYLTRAS